MLFQQAGGRVQVRRAAGRGWTQLAVKKPGPLLKSKLFPNMTDDASLNSMNVLAP